MADKVAKTSKARKKQRQKKAQQGIGADSPSELARLLALQEENFKQCRNH
jgi:hypothetical protein